MKLSKSLSDQLIDTNQLILEILSSNEYMREIMEYVTAQKGKQLRPLLCLCASEFGNKKSKDAVLFSAIIEIIHMASLIHDDIIDKADMRRGMPSVQKKYGVDMAVYAGDYMLARAFHALCDITNVRRYQLLLKYFKVLVDSEINQYFQSYNLNITEEEYLSNIYGKTSCLFEFACVCGAKSASAKSQIVNALKRFGLNFGMLFQIRDDIFNFKNQLAEGKPCMNDFQNGIYTLPLIYTIQNQREAIQTLKKSVAEEGLQKETRTKLLLLIQNSNAIAKCAEKSKEYYDAGLSALSKLPDNNSKIVMTHLLEQVYRDILTCNFL